MAVTARQRKILEAVVREFMKSAEPVGSVSIVSEYDLDVSPATVRNEMVRLSELGYLEKAHSSAGRMPTDLGLRFFIQELMNEENLSNMERVDMQIDVFKNRFELDHLMQGVLDYLAGKTNCAGVSLVDDTLRSRGLSNLMQYEELRDVDVMEIILRIMESRSLIRKIFDEADVDDVRIVIGKECDIDKMNCCSVVFSSFNYIGDQRGYVGIIGPRRMPYYKVIPAVRSVSTVLEDAVRGW